MLNFQYVTLSTVFACLLFSSDVTDSTENNRCPHHMVAKNNQIILTKQSENNGAIYLKSINKASVDECLNSCCELPECNLAVFNNRASHTCFMFDCKTPSVCSFMAHDNYVTLTKVIAIPANKSHPKPPAKPRVKKPVSLGGQCGEGRVCADAFSTCSKNHVCYCSTGYIQKHGKCVKSVCPKPDFEFQCDDPTRSPACVAIYDTCNGIPQCGDSSDEKNCVASENKKPKTNESPKDDGKRREERPIPSTKTTTAQGKGRKTHKVSPPPHHVKGRKKASVTIYANNTDTSDSKKKPVVAAIPPVASEEYVAMLQKSYQQSKIAVVVLGLTLGVTAFALAFFICRVRRIKNRLRRGKALTSDEADYLINGMYL